MKKDSKIIMNKSPNNFNGESVQSLEEDDDLSMKNVDDNKLHLPVTPSHMSVYTILPLIQSAIAT